MTTEAQMITEIRHFTTALLEQIWDDLRVYDGKDEYAEGISMDQWATQVEAELNLRKEGLGFICPKWAINYWNRETSLIVRCTDGLYGLLDDEIQEMIYVGSSEEAVGMWLAYYQD